MDGRKVEKLSVREIEVLRYIAAGFTAKEVGVKLGIALDTIKTHIAGIRRKLKAKNSAHAVALAFRQGILKWKE